jgi:hypothetical protein
MTLKETENARAITFLRQADGGLGITSTENIADTAFVGTWTVTIQNVIKKQIMMATPELDSIRSITLIKDVTEATERIRNLIANDDSFRSSKDRQKLLGKTGTPNCLEDLLKRVSKDGGIDEIQHLSRDGYRHTQRRLSHAVSLMYANALAKRLRLQDTDNKGIYIQFEGQRQKLSMKGLNRAHLSPKARGLTNKQMRIDLAIALLVVLHPIRNCPLCGVTEVHFFQHCERCDKSNNSLNNIKKGYRRTYDTHKGLKREISYYTRFLPFISKGDHEPKPSDYFFLKDDEHQTPRSPSPNNNSDNIRGDILLIFQEAQGEEICILDVTVRGIHMKSYGINQMEKDTGYFKYGATAELGDKHKIVTYKRWDHDGRIIPFALDTAGGISKNTLKFIQKMFSRKDQHGNIRDWPSEAYRVLHKKRFMDRISQVLRIERVKMTLRLLGKDDSTPQRQPRSVQVQHTPDSSQDSNQIAPDESQLSAQIASPIPATPQPSPQTTAPTIAISDASQLFSQMTISSLATSQDSEQVDNPVSSLTVSQDPSVSLHIGDNDIDTYNDHSISNSNSNSTSSSNIYNSSCSCSSSSSNSSSSSSNGILEQFHPGSLYAVASGAELT